MKFLLSKAILIGAISLSSVGVIDLGITKAEASQQDVITSYVKDNGATISLKITNNSNEITFSQVVIQQFINGQWVEPDYNIFNLELYPDFGWNYDTLYYLKGNGGELPTGGIFRFKITTVTITNVDLGTVYSEQFNF